jgi:TetR/AcrR family transcriptional regulator, fatty acid biosynthesis regulator
MILSAKQPCRAGCTAFRGDVGSFFRGSRYRHPWAVLLTASDAKRGISRSEAKQVTRDRLLSEALNILDHDGRGSLSASAVARAAGVAQSTFYVHFQDLDELLRELADSLMVGRRRAVREARRAARESPASADRVREAFRVPLELTLAHPRLFRLAVPASHDRSVLGAALREMNREDREALVDDLILHGYRTGTPSERRSVEIIADAFTGTTTAIGAGILEGRYSIDEALDVIMRLVSGLKPLIGPPPRNDRLQRPDPVT